MTKASRAGATRLRRDLPEEIAIWEILVRLPPKSLLRCRAVCRAWRRATSTRAFLQAHHHRQPCLPIVCGSENGAAGYENFLALDHRAACARLQPVVRLERSFYPEASCDGLLLLSTDGMTGAHFTICNPATRQHAPLPQLSGFSVFGMYSHRPSGEYRLLLHQTLADQICCYVFVLGSDQPPRYIGVLEVAASAYLHKAALVRDNLHLYPVHYGGDPQQYQTGSEVIIVFDTTSESFRQMRAPVVPVKSYIFEMDDTLGIYSYNATTQIVDIWMLQNYESEVWRYKCSVKLPVVQIKGRFGGWLNDDWYVCIHSVHGDILLLVNHGGWMFHVDADGKLVDDFHCDGQHVYACKLRLKQTLVPHTFFAALEGYDVNTSPFV